MGACYVRRQFTWVWNPAGHSDRPAHRVIVKSRFASLDSIDDVIARLIGV
jgi:hypothetical protein